MGLRHGVRTRPGAGLNAAPLVCDAPRKRSESVLVRRWCRKRSPQDQFVPTEEALTSARRVSEQGCESGLRQSGDGSDRAANQGISSNLPLVLRPVSIVWAVAASASGNSPPMLIASSPFSTHAKISDVRHLKSLIVAT